MVKYFLNGIIQGSFVLFLLDSTAYSLYHFLQQVVVHELLELRWVFQGVNMSLILAIFLHLILVRYQNYIVAPWWYIEVLSPIIIKSLAATFNGVQRGPLIKSETLCWSVPDLEWVPLIQSLVEQELLVLDVFLGKATHVGDFFAIATTSELLICFISWGKVSCLTSVFLFWVGTQNTLYWLAILHCLDQTLFDLMLGLWWVERALAWWGEGGATKVAATLFDSGVIRLALTTKCKSHWLLVFHTVHCSIVCALLN